MYYFLHLALPGIVAILVEVSTSHMDLNMSWLQRMSNDLPAIYLMFAAPHWIWAGASSFFAASKTTVVGGFIGLHLLLCSVWLLVAQSTEPHSANGWFLYWLGAPVITAIGALLGRFVGQRQQTQAT